MNVLKLWRLSLLYEHQSALKYTIRNPSEYWIEHVTMNHSSLQVLPLPVATGKEIIVRYLAKKNRTVSEKQKELILKALKVRVQHYRHCAAFVKILHIVLYYEKKQFSKQYERFELFVLVSYEVNFDCSVEIIFYCFSFRNNQVHCS